MIEEWLVPFKGRNSSGTYGQNFLYKYGNIYLMDNHKAALWCWMQHIEKDSKYDLFHLDRHTDTLNSRTAEWTSELKELRGMQLEDYLSRTYDQGGYQAPVLRWDNYLSIFLEMYPQLLNKCWFATREGDKPIFEDVNSLSAEEVLIFLRSRSNNSDNIPLIINIDLDYFCRSNFEKGIKQSMTDNYIESLFAVCKTLFDRNDISCMTIALSPEWCGGWPSSERLCAIACGSLRIPFKLPH